MDALTEPLQIDFEQPHLPSATIVHGDSLHVLRGYAENTIDAIVCDPPYGLTDLPRKKVEGAIARWLAGDREYVPGGAGFMSARWDRFVPPPALWDEALRVLKPGGYLVAFAGARTLDLMGLSIRLAGFEVRDILAWIRADTFAKAPGTLKSGHEPIVMARKPFTGTTEQNVATWGTGLLNVEACRVPYRNAADEAETKTKNQHATFGSSNGATHTFGDYSSTEQRNYDAPGRQPSNVVLDQAAADLLDSQHPVTRSRKGKENRPAKNGDAWGMRHGGQEHDDIGGPSRFFTIADEDEASTGFAYAGRAVPKERPVGPDGTRHSTVKPLSIMRWLVKLVTPAGGTVLDPFVGSGTTLEAALLEGFDCIGVESEMKHIPLIEQRVARVGTA